MKQEQVLEQKLENLQHAQSGAYELLQQLYNPLQNPTFKRKLDLELSNWGYEDPTGNDRDWTESVIEIIEKVEGCRREMFVAQREYFKIINQK